MIIAIDVHYREDYARIVALAFHNWEDTQPFQTYIAIKNDIVEYEPGAFYKRELPCIVEIMKSIDLTQVQYIIVDGYVYLDDTGKKGLGYYVYDYYEGKIPIIGVAKSRFFENAHYVRPILRGESQSPLYITAIGINLDEAAQNIKNMYGDYRMPTLLKLLDTLTKE